MIITKHEMRFTSVNHCFCYCLFCFELKPQITPLTSYLQIILLFLQYMFVHLNAGGRCSAKTRMPIQFDRCTKFPVLLNLMSDYCLTPNDQFCKLYQGEKTLHSMKC